LRYKNGEYAVLLIFFFFQAEDGIRDGHVTGVQTCALPISVHALVDNGRGRRMMRVEGGRKRIASACHGCLLGPVLMRTTFCSMAPRERALRLPSGDQTKP